jgi:hypothetical protein
MKTMTLLAIVVSAVLAGSALADKPTKADKPTTGTKPAKMTCEEFLALDDIARPKLVYWAEGVSRKGKPEDAVFDVETTDRLVPVLVEVCTKAPHESFWTKAKAEFKKVF